MTEPTVHLDLESPVPPSEQIRVRVQELIRTGALAPSTRLPSVRTLAGDLGIAPNTVVRAYTALEEDGLVRTLGRRGTLVADAPPAPDDAEVGAAVERAVAVARVAGWDDARIRATVDAALGVRPAR